MAKFNYDAFICYRRIGGGRDANHLPSRLKEYKIKVFHDHEAEAEVGDFWENKLKPAIDSSRIVIILLSKNFFRETSNNDDIVKKEIEYAVSMNKPIIPVILENSFTDRDWEQIPADWKTDKYVYQGKTRSIEKILKRSEAITIYESKNDDEEIKSLSQLILKYRKDNNKKPNRLKLKIALISLIAIAACISTFFCIKYFSSASNEQNTSNSTSDDINIIEPSNKPYGKATNSIETKYRLSEYQNWEEGWDTNIENFNVGQKVDFRIQFLNSTNEIANNVTVKSYLPSCLEYMQDSTYLYDTSHPNGVQLSNTISLEGVNIGNYEPDANAYIIYSIKIINNELTRQQNIATLYSSFYYNNTMYYKSDNINIKYVISGWGDNDGGRRTYTLEEINNGALLDKNYAIINSISNSTIGNELNFVGARIYDGDHGANNKWEANTVWVEEDSEYVVRLYVHNNQYENRRDCVAKNTHVCFNVPGKSDKQNAIHGYIKADNCYPSACWDGVLFESDKKFHFEYVSRSGLLESNGIGASNEISNGYELTDNIITQDGVMIGNEIMDGNIYPDYINDCGVTILVKVVFDE